MNRKVSPSKTLAGHDVIARLAVGAEAVDDNLGAVLVVDIRVGFAVFIDGGMLPDGGDVRTFPAASPTCLRDAYTYALEVVQELVDEQVEA